MRTPRTSLLPHSLLWFTAVGAGALHCQQDGHVPQVPAPDPSAAWVAAGYDVEVVLRDLDYATSVDLDRDGNLYVAESGYSYGDPSARPRILRVAPDGQIRVLAQDGLDGPVNDLLWHDGRLFISHRGRISVFEQDNIRDLVTGLPSDGDHQNNQISAGPDGKLYFGQGTATNSGVVGKDNHAMGWLQKHPDFHDHPAQTIELVGRVFATPDPLTYEDGDQARTSAFHAFGESAPDGGEIAGRTKATGTILRMDPDGSGLEVYAWGLRNPFGVQWSPQGKLYVTENGCDVRGSRPIANDMEDLYVIEQGDWCGWPDFASGVPVTDPRFAPKDGPAPEFLLREHPEVAQPLLTFPEHSAIAKLDFCPGGEFGFDGQAFVAFFGHMAPMTGNVDEHGGHRVVRIDLATKATHPFFSQQKHGNAGHAKGGHGEEGGHAEDADAGGAKHDQPTQGSGHSKDESVSAGPRRLVDVRFAPDGSALYIADFGTMIVEQKPVPVPATGVIWRIVPHGKRVTSPPAGLSANAATAKER